MTELKLNSKTESPIKGSRPDRRLVLTTVFSGVLLVTLFLGINAASKMQSKKAITDPTNQNSPVVDASMEAVNAASTPAPTSAPVQAVAKKRTVRKRPSTVTYVDGTYGVSFRYPRKFALKSPEPGSSTPEHVAMNFVEAGGVPVVTVDLPGGLYKNTDFVSGFFQVSVNKSLSAEQCGQFAALRSGAEGDSAAAVTIPLSESETSPVVPLKASFRGMEFSQLEMANDLSNTRYYHRYENGGCYEFALGLQTAVHESVDDMPPVDDRDVFARLEKILASVRIKSAPVPEATTAATAVAEGEESNH